MAGFVESATLRVQDEASRPIKNINRELNALLVTAKRISGTRIGFKMDLAGLAQAGSQLRTLHNLAGRNFRLNFNTSQLGQAVSQANALAAAMTRAASASNSAAAAAARFGARPPSVPSVPGPRGYGGGSGWVGINRPFPQNVPGAINRALAWTVGGSVANGGRNLVTTAGGAILQADTNTNLSALRGMPTDVAAAVERSSLDASKRFGMVAGVELYEAAAQAALQLSNPLKDLPHAANSIARNASAYTLLYGDKKTGVEASYQGVRAAQILGHANTAEGIDWVTDAIARATIGAGRDVNAAQTATILANAGYTKGSLSKTALIDLVGLQDEMRFKTASNYRTFVGDLLRGNLTQPKKDEQIEMGIRDKRGNTIAEYRNLAGDPFELAWKIWDKFGEGKVDGKDPAAVAQFFEKFIGKTGAELGVTAVTQRSQILQTREKANAVALSDKDVERLKYRSMVASGRAIESAYKDLSNAATKMVQPIVAPIGGVIADTLRGMAGLSPGKSMTAAAGMGLGVGAVGLATYAAKHAMDNPGLTASAAAHGFAARAHSVAAGAHVRTAGGLTAAAARLGAAGALGGLGGGIGAGAAAAGAAGAASRLSTVGGWATKAMFALGVLDAAGNAWNELAGVSVNNSAAANARKAANAIGEVGLALASIVNPVARVASVALAFDQFLRASDAASVNKGITDSKREQAAVETLSDPKASTPQKAAAKEYIEAVRRREAADIASRGPNAMPMDAAVRDFLKGREEAIAAAKAKQFNLGPKTPEMDDVRRHREDAARQGSKGFWERVHDVVFPKAFGGDLTPAVRRQAQINTWLEDWRNQTQSGHPDNTTKTLPPGALAAPSADLRAIFESGAASIAGAAPSIAAAGTEAGASIASAGQGIAASITAAMATGFSVAASISAAMSQSVNVNVNNTGNTRPVNTGTNPNGQP